MERTKENSRDNSYTIYTGTLSDLITELHQTFRQEIDVFWLPGPLPVFSVSWTPFVVRYLYFLFLFLFFDHSSTYNHFSSSGSNGPVPLLLEVHQSFSGLIPLRSLFLVSPTRKGGICSPKLPFFVLLHTCFAVNSSEYTNRIGPT